MRKILNKLIFKYRMILLSLTLNSQVLSVLILLISLLKSDTFKEAVIRKKKNMITIDYSKI